MSLQKVLLSALFAIGLLQISSAQTNKIAEGTNAATKKYFYQALIMENGEYKCGGSIINRRTILTAASCVPNKDDPFSYAVIVGDFDKNGIDGSEQGFVPMKIIHKEEYNSTTREHDIALLQLYLGINFDEFVNEIRLAEPNSIWYFDRPATVTGWGDADPILKGGPAQIKKNKDDCSIAYPDVVKEINILCVTSGACSKDQGGPLTSVSDGKTIQVGIASTLPVCQEGTTSQSLGLFIEIAPYTSWIDSQIGDVDTGAGHVSKASKLLMVLAGIVMILVSK